MKDTNYWKRYPIITDANEILHHLTLETFVSSGKEFQLLALHNEQFSSCVLISPGSGGHAFVFAELAYMIYKKGYNVFVMPKQGGFTINELMVKHEDAVNYLNGKYKYHLHLYGEGLGGLVVFYLALKGIKVKSIICENAPAILTETAFHKAMKEDGKAGKRRTILLHFFKLLVKIAPFLPIPIRLYLAWNEMIDIDPQNRVIEARIVEAYNNDPDFDKSYPLKAVMSLVNTRPPNEISRLAIPTLFILAKRGVIPAYIKDLFSRLQLQNKKLQEVEGGVFWMLSNPDQASDVIVKWINEVK